MKTSTKYFLIILAILLSQTLSSQKWIRYGDEAYNNLQFEKAIAYYEKANNKNETKESLLGLAKCYQKTNNASKASEFYKTANDNDFLENESKVEYAKVLYDSQNYDELFPLLNHLEENRTESPTIKIIKESLKNQDQMKHDSIFFNVKPFLTDENFSYFSPTIYDNGLLVVSNNATSIGSKTESWKGGYYFDIYQVINGKQASLGAVINSALHEASPAYCQQFQMLYFTKSNVKKKNKATKNDQDENVFQIYSSEKINNVWSKPELFVHSNEDYSSGHPAITEDGKKLFFISDKPGGLGKTDIYYCNLVDGVWSEPINLGNVINTPGKEMFPTLKEKDGVISLYFSSDYKIGMGGLDIYVSENTNGEWSIPKHLTYPINTEADEFGLIWKDEESGYLSSNRNNENLADGIYEFNKVSQKFFVAGYVTDGKTKKPIDLADITLDDSFYDRKTNFSTDENGYFVSEINPNSNFDVWAAKQGFPSDMKSISTIGLTRSDTIFVNFELFKRPEFHVVGIVKDKATNEPIEGGTIVFQNEITAAFGKETSDENGEFLRKIDSSSSYELAANAPNYFLQKAGITTIGLTESDTLYVEFALEKLEVNKTIRLDNIYYDFNRASIRKDAIPPLNDFVEVLKNNPSIKIELSSHTDSRGKDSYNQKLSERRAKSVIKYLASKGIDKSRLTAKGYGESKLLNKCADRIKCSDEEHQFNRRTEFKVLSK